MLASSSCGGTETSASLAQSVIVSVTPSTATLAGGQSLTLQAAVTATVNTMVTWSVVEGSSGGSVTSAGVYTAPATGGVYRVVATSQADPTASGGATVTVTAPPPPGGSGMTTAHRTSGVAPLSVFFDAVNTAPSGYASPFTWNSGVYQPSDYEGTLYSWTFGDPSSGTWTQTGNSRNTATGYTAAHVYESPGTYTTSLTITDLTGTVRTYTQTITVSDFSGTTYYVASNGSDSNNGLSTSTPFLTVAKGMSKINTTNTRLLFRRGDTFSSGAGQWTITANGPGIIGAYGPGAPPVVNSSYTGDLDVIRIGAADWRIMDLTMHGPGGQYFSGAVGFDAQVQAVNVLFLRLTLPNWNVSLGWSDWTPIFQTPNDGITIMECEAPSATQNGMYVGGRRLAILGNNIHDVVQSHVLRVWQAHKAVISNNRLWKPGGQRHCLKLHGPSLSEANRNLCPETRWVTVNDNIVAASTTSQWSVSMGPQDSINDERPTHIVYERNRHHGSPSTTIHIEGSASFVMIRNNILDGTSDDYFTGVGWHRRGIEPIPTNIRIYNNTYYKGDSNRETYIFDIGSEVANCVIRNNLANLPGQGTYTLLAGGGGTGFVQSNNLLTTDAAAGLFTNASGGDFTLPVGSPAVDVGATLPEVREGFDRVARPRGAGYDLGAFESH